MSAVVMTAESTEVRSIQKRSVAVLSAGSVLGGVAVAGSVAAGALIAESVSGSEAAAGLAQTMGVLGAAVLALPLARIALGRGRRAALATGYGLGALGSVVVVAAAVTRSLPLVLVGCFLVGVASASTYQARYAATDLATEEHRAVSLSWVVWAGTIGAVVGPNLLNASGQLGMWLGLPQLAGPYVVAGVCLALAALVLVLFLRPDPYRLSLRLREHTGEVVRRPKLREGLTHLRGRPRAVLGIAAIAVGHVVMVMVMVMTPVHMAHVDVTLQLIGFVISVHVAGMYALSPVVGWAVDRFGRLQVISAGVVILALACGISGVAAGDNVPLLAVGLFLLGLGWSCTLIAGSTLVTDEVETTERPAVQGLSDLVMNAAGAVGGAAAGIIVLVSSYGWLCAAGLVPLIGLVALMASPACRTHSNMRSM
ncbi:MAG: MFS transporter [Candidatus Nanopelagicales bacterium]|nr:MFS transporter [Candidatus Nanopelagicales bacterium]MCF8556791.1 MFS transporter [Candidatus Nanopelagicales bacterium]